MKPVTRVVWFKRDLRTQDHRPLEQALLRARQQVAQEGGSVLCLFVHEPGVLKSPEWARQHSAFLRECLDDLQCQLQALGGDLLEACGEVTDVLDALLEDARQRGHALSLWSHQETTGQFDFSRDRAVNAWCRDRGVRHCEFEQNAVVRGSRNRAPDFHHAQSFEAHIRQACQQPLARVTSADCKHPAGGSLWRDLPWHSVDPESVPQGSGEDKPGRMRGGRAAALARLEVFAGFDRLADYPKFISTPLNAEEGCSRLSPHLSWAPSPTGRW
jgi:deoxyribodipyrimidine photo-lyase